MSGHGPSNTPRPEQLAAYVDGELGCQERAQVEAWLAEHPEAVAEVESLRRLTAAWQASMPSEPSEAQWAHVLAGIEAAVARGSVVRPSSRRWLVAGAGALAAAAAAVILAVALTRPPQPAPSPDVEPWPVATADEIEIISIHASDAPAMVVGEPPVREALALLSPGDVTVNAVKSDVHGMDPCYVRSDSAAPMIIMMPREGEP